MLEEKHKNFKKGEMLAATKVKMSGSEKISQQEHIKVGTHLATSCSNTSQRQITPCEQIGQQVAATR